MQIVIEMLGKRSFIRCVGYLRAEERFFFHKLKLANKKKIKQ